MTTESQQVKRPRLVALEGFLIIVLLIISFRLTSVAVLLILALLYLCFRWHRSRRALIATYIVFFVTLTLPADIDVAGFHGRIYDSKHSGLRFVRMVKGLANHQRCREKYGEFIPGGCVGGMHDPKWILVWD